jgi:secreted trypsin-like serine protease
VAEGWKNTLFGGFMDPKTGAIHKVQSTNSSSSVLLQPSGIDPKIIGGSNASPGEFPWQVSIQVVQGGSRFHMCGGSILSNNKIATAAHCCAGQTAASLVVVAGAHNIQTNEASQQASVVNRIVMHSDYDP